jgi:cation diffusion facilitator CzcD-associated flavoprotein CzcO
MSNKVANRLAYDFWAKKTRARITDATKADILAPLEPLHPFGAKRPSLEQNYYEELNRPNVHVVSVKQTPITRFCPEGVVTSDGKVHEADLIVLGTGFDAVTGGLKNITITGLDGQLLSDKWKSGTYTNLGLATAGFPNFFFTYGPQSPTAFSNGPTCVETQGDWIAEVLVKMRESGLTRINATKEAENEWKAKVNLFSERTLLHDTDSWSVYSASLHTSY